MAQPAHQPAPVSGPPAPFGTADDGGAVAAPARLCGPVLARLRPLLVVVLVVIHRLCSSWRPDIGWQTSATLAPGLCSSPRPPPYQYHGKYTDAQFEAEYMLTSDELQSALLAKRYPAFEAFLWKLASGRKVQIGVVGGSFTMGGDCMQLIDGNETWDWACSWVSRFKEWMEHFFPNADVAYQRMVRGGTATCEHLALLPLILKTQRQNGVLLDLITVETLVNGNAQPAIDHFCYELLLRAVHELTPSTAVFVVFAGPGTWFDDPAVWENAVAEVEVARHYGVPYVDFAKLVHERHELWFLQAGTADGHPAWQTHQMLADLIAQAWGGAWDAACGGAHSSTAGESFPLNTYYQEEELRPFEPCLRLVSSYSASDSAASYFNGAVTGVGPTVLAGNWTLYEDRPRKPGWISTQNHSILQFNVTFGPRPLLLVVYLRSYMSLGDAVMTVAPQDGWQDGRTYNIVLHGLWADKVSQADTHRVTWINNWDGDGGGDFTLPPNGTAQLLFENVGVKFKIMSVFSC